MLPPVYGASTLGIKSALANFTGVRQGVVTARRYQLGTRQSNGNVLVYLLIKAAQGEQLSPTNDQEKLLIVSLAINIDSY